jgi:hypothetical protein
MPLVLASVFFSREDVAGLNQGPPLCVDDLRRITKYPRRVPMYGWRSARLLPRGARGPNSQPDLGHLEPDQCVRPQMISTMLT